MDRKKVIEKFIEYQDYMNDRVELGIETNRKGFAYLNLVDKDGEPIKNAKITVTQKNHEFKYGANIFMLDEFECDEKNAKYKELFRDAFNMATLPFYWKDLEPERGKTRYEKDSPKVYRRPSTDLCMEYCEENGIEPREHALAYANWFPTWLDLKNINSVKAELERRYAEISSRYADKIPTIEVTNETWWDDFGIPIYEENDFIEWCFQLAEKYFPYNKLAINEHGGVWNEQARDRDKYFMQIQRAISKGARIDEIGMQYHMFFQKEAEFENTRKFYDPVHLYKIMDKYGEFKLPMELTEVTIPAYSNAPEDEELQATIINYLYHIWFSHPNIEHIIYWNVVDGYAAFAPQGDMKSGENYYYGGLVRFDMSPKPSYYTIKNLFEKEWRTNTDITSNNAGKASFKGFFGEYDLKINVDGKEYKKTINLSKGYINEYRIELSK